MSDILDELKDTTADGDDAEAPTHLVVMVNGLFGHMDNWKVIRRNLEDRGLAPRMLVLASNTNLKLQTFDGVDTCGKRLAEELQDAIKEHTSLTSISVFGHSMGGLIARHALGLLYDRDSRKICGLKPRHFISLATPHLGCGGKGPAEVPFIRWFADIPLLGYPIGAVLYGMSDPFAKGIMRRTGKQFFLLDKDDGKKPLLVRMAEDSEDEAFFSSLSSFASRTCIANSSGDHLVGWANASVRAVSELPDLGDVSKAKGVVRADDVTAAFWQPGAEASVLSRQDSSNATWEREQRSQKPAAAAETILKSLQRLPWTRMDCSFKGTTFPFFAHNLIQVTREWINWEGRDMTKQIAEHFAQLEEQLQKAEHC